MAPHSSLFSLGWFTVCEEYLAMQYYCLYLNHSEGRKLNCLTNHPCTP